MDMQWLATVETAIGMVGWKVWAGAGAVLVGLIILIALMRAERSMANAVLAIVSLFAVGVGLAIAVLAPGARAISPGFATAEPVVVTASPALACLDGLAGDTVEAACERTLFATPAMTAAAVSYVAGQVVRLEAARGGSSSGDLHVIRRTLAADRYGLVARVLITRNNCTPDTCATFALLGNSSNVARNMREETYQALVARNAPGWNGPVLASAPASPQADPAAAGGSAAPASMVFPSASSIPPVSIMNSEPQAAERPAGAPDGGNGASQDEPARRAATPTPKPRRPAAAQQSAPVERRAARPPPAAAPIQIAPGADADAQDDN